MRKTLEGILCDTEAPAFDTFLSRLNSGRKLFRQRFHRADWRADGPLPRCWKPPPNP